jgi:glycosyltransferase involved in cell wall biosynthesis
MLALDLSGIGVRSTNRRPSPFKRALARAPMLRLYRDLAVSAQAVRATADYDLFISMVYVLPAFSRARRGVVLCQFPYQRDSRPRRGGVLRPVAALYSWPYRSARRLVFGGEIDDFDAVICQSEYVQRWVRRLWQRDSLVINPPIDVPEEEPDWDSKGRLIVSVGRFFAGGHSKRHDVMVQAFRRICDSGETGWELHLAGSVHRDRPADVEYFERVVELARGYPVHLHTDASLEEVRDLYWRAGIYWHAAGFGADENRDPARLEHFGMTTAEAMAHGAVPVAIGRGGQPEVVEEGVTGYLWNAEEELRARTVELMRDPALRRRLGAAARMASHRFSRAEFKRRMREALQPLVHELEGLDATRRPG